jgi:hypothetical protein
MRRGRKGNRVGEQWIAAQKEKESKGGRKVIRK